MEYTPRRLDNFHFISIIRKDHERGKKGMSKEEIFEKVRTLVAEKLGVDEDEVELESSLEEDLGADSLDLVDLTMAIEDEFGVRVEDEELEKIKTVEDIVKRLSKELGSDEEE